MSKKKIADNPFVRIRRFHGVSQDEAFTKLHTFCDDIEDKWDYRGPWYVIHERSVFKDSKGWCGKMVYEVLLHEDAQ